MSKEFDKVQDLLVKASAEGKIWLKKDYTLRATKLKEFKIGKKFIWKHWTGTTNCQIETILDDFIICKKI